MREGGKGGRGGEIDRWGRFSLFEVMEWNFIGFFWICRADAGTRGVERLLSCMSLYLVRA